MRLVILLLLSLTILSCQPATERCANEELLLKPYGDSLPVFELTEGMPALQRFLDSVHAVQMKDPEQLMRFYFKASLFTLCSFDPWEMSVGMVAVTIRHRQTIEVLLNDHGQLLVDGELATCASLDSIWKGNLRNNGLDPRLAINPKRAILLLSFSSGAPIDSLAKILSTIHQAHNDIIAEEIRSKYAVSFCELPKDSIRAVIEKYPLRIFIPRDGYAYPPPPPPPLGKQQIL